MCKGEDCGDGKCARKDAGVREKGGGDAVTARRRRGVSVRRQKGDEAKNNAVWLQLDERRSAQRRHAGE